jgi:anion transporter
MHPATITLIVLVIVSFLFITELIPLAITAMGGAIALAVLGVIPHKAAFSGLAHHTVVLFASMFVIGAAMFHTGLAQKIGESIVRLTGKTERGLLLGTMGATALVSSVASNTGTTATMMPVILGICAAAEMPASRQLMPLAFAAGLGGNLTLVGAPHNVLCSAQLSAAGFRSFSFFEFLWIGIPITVIGILYMLTIGKRLLPEANLSADQAIKQEFIQSTKDPKKMWICAVILLTCITVMAIDSKTLPLDTTAAIGAIICVLTGCLKEKQAYQAIDWKTIFLFAGMLPVATALDKSGAGKIIADYMLVVLGDNPSPILITAVIWAGTSLMTQFMSNTATAALLAPIAVSLAKSIGADPTAVMMAIAVGASSAFATPVGTPPNTLVMGPGNYRFMDFVKAGTPLLLISFVVSIIVIPMVWPFYPAK